MLTLPDVLGMVWRREKAVGQDKVQMNPSWLLEEVQGVGRSGHELSFIYCVWGDHVSGWLAATERVSNTLRRG